MLFRSNIHTRFSEQDLRLTMVGIMEQLTDDLRIYATRRNGLLHVQHLPDRDKQRSAARYHNELPLIINSLKMNVGVAVRELDAHYECLGEAVQTVLRRHGVFDAYEIVKKVTRGAQMNRTQYQQMIADILGSPEVKGKLPPEAEQYLLSLQPEDFTGKAEELALMK